MIDGKHNKCAASGCGKSPTYNIQGERKPLFCVDHKTSDMVDVFHKKCEYEGCDKRPLYNYQGVNSAKWCVYHRHQTMIDVFAKKCLSEWCNTIVSQKYDGYCVFCYVNLFPDKAISRNYKTKESAVNQHINCEFPEISWVFDKNIIEGCSRRRPDIFVDLGYQIIIVEIDENQHQYYDCTCENRRVMELSRDVGHRPIVIIRFNPDAYINHNGQMITSCWRIQNKTGILHVNKNKQIEWNERLHSLKTQIQYWLANSTDKTVEIIQLYYDGAA
jgi:hypothetical protein